jgi:acetate kinase
VHRIRALVGSMIASLRGLDALVFTAGIGENASAVRAAVCSGWEFLGLQLDPEKNADTPTDVDVAANESAVRVLVIHTQEDWEIAVECFRLTKARFPAR